MKHNSLIHVKSLYIKIADFKLWWLGKGGGGGVHGALERVATHRGPLYVYFKLIILWYINHPI